MDHKDQSADEVLFRAATVLYSEKVPDSTTVIQVAVRGSIDIHSNINANGPTSIYVRFAPSYGRTFYERHGRDPGKGKTGNFLFLGNNYRDSESGYDGAWFLGECRVTRTVSKFTGAAGQPIPSHGQATGYGQSSFSLGSFGYVNGFTCYGNGGWVNDAPKIEVVAVGPHKVEEFYCKVDLQTW